MRRFIGLLALWFVGIGLVSAQSDPFDVDYEDEGGYLFGVKGGVTLGTQNWGSFEREPLIGYHGDLFIESLPELEKFSLWAQLGYHQRGSSLQRQIGASVTGQVFTTPAQSFIFENIVLGLGGKQVFAYLGAADAYWLLGLRAEYNIDTNLDEFDRISDFAQRRFFPFESYDFINRFVFGVSVGAGLSFPLGESTDVLLELNIQPDFTLQYNQPEIGNVINPFTSVPTSIPARQIRNISIELSAGFRFRRRIIYID
ncbi:MAG: hypothetical protein AAFY36_01565 [Bacteroidota bacterium]